MTVSLLLLACARAPDAHPRARTVDPAVAPPPAATAPTDPTTAGTSGPPATTPQAPTEFPTIDGQPLELCINELVADSAVSFVGDDGVPSDWIELHNPTAAPVPLAGWSITDDPAEPQLHRLDGSLVVEPGGYVVLLADDRPELGPTHLGFALSDEGEAVALFAPDGDGSVVWFGPVASDLALARVTDCCADVEGESCFGYLFAGTPGATNED